VVAVVDNTMAEAEAELVVLEQAQTALSWLVHLILLQSVLVEVLH
jgi:hypothetical protein